jgi:GTP-binding protein LepA
MNAIIAHIDHGKSTLADRFLEMTGALCRRARWRRRCSTRWTSSASAASRSRRTRSAELHGARRREYVLNLIDTPGHVDFSYEVTRSLAACEGALLLVDASQGVEAQTLANAYLAVENNLEIIPVINKIDLPGAQPDEARGRSRTSSASTRGRDPRQRQEGTGVDEILEAIVARCRRRRAIPTRRSRR